MTSQQIDTELTRLTLASIEECCRCQRITECTSYGWRISLRGEKVSVWVCTACRISIADT